MVSFWFYLLYGNDGRCERIQISHIVDCRWTNDLVYIHALQYIWRVSQLVNKRINMFQYTKKWEDQKIDPVDTLYKIDQVKLVKWLRHLRDLNHLLMNDLLRDDREREKARGAFNAYDCLLGNITSGTIFMKNRS